MIPRKPMTSFYEAIRCFLEHPHDDTGSADFGFQFSLYVEPPFETRIGDKIGDDGWRPHPLCLHPPSTDSSRALVIRIIKGESEMGGAKVKIDPARQQQAIDMVETLSRDLDLDHVYCLNLIRAASAEDVRKWVEQKMGRRGRQRKVTEGAKEGNMRSDMYRSSLVGLHGVQSSMITESSHHDLEATARSLFFIEKRAALNALLELVQARIGMGLMEAKQHAVMVATDSLIAQGLPSVLMERISKITRDIRCRGRSAAETEFEIERQKAADCLFFLFYQTQILPSELLSLPAFPQEGVAATGLPTLPSSLPPASHPSPVTLIGLVKLLTEDMKGRFSVVAVGEEQEKSREERAVLKTLSTLLMTLVTCLMTLDGLAAHPDARAGQQELTERGRMEGERNALLLYLEEEGGLRAATEAKQAYEKAYRTAHATHPTLPAAVRETLKEKEKAFKDTQARISETLSGLRGEIEGGWAHAGIHAVVLLAWGAFFRDQALSERLGYVQDPRTLPELRKELLTQAVGQAVFPFLERGMVACWRRPGQEDIQMFFLDCVGELVGGYLREGQGILVRRLVDFARGEAAGDAMGYRRAAVEGLVSLVVRLGESHPAVGERLLWTRAGGRDGGELEPVQFVKDLSELIKNETQAPLRSAWIRLVGAMTVSSNEECKAATMDFLVDYSPFLSLQTRQNRDVLTYVLEDSLQRAQQNQPVHRASLLGVLLLVERLTSPTLALDPDLAYVSHLLPLLTSLLSFPLAPELKGALLRALAPFAALPDGMARQLWEHIEMLGMVPRQGKKEGLRFELEDVESKMGLFPITEGFLLLLVALLRADMPFDLGAARGRQDGVWPYVEYLIEDILLPLPARQFLYPAQKWKILSLGLRVLILVLERYPLEPDEERLRLLHVDSRQRREMHWQAQRDMDPQVGHSPSIGFHVLMRLLGSSTGAGGGVPSGNGGLLGLVLDVVAAADLSAAPMPGSYSGSTPLGEQQRVDMNGLPLIQYPTNTTERSSGDACPPGPWRLEKQNRLQEAQAWDEAVLVFDDEEGLMGRGGRGDRRGESRDGGEGTSWRAAGLGGKDDEVSREEDAVCVAFELLNNVLCKDVEFKRLHTTLVEHPFFEGAQVATLNEIVARGYADGALGVGMGRGAEGRRGRKIATISSSASPSASILAQGLFLPLLAQYSAYDVHPPLRLQASLCLRTLMARVPQPQDLLDMFRPLPALGAPGTGTGREGGEEDGHRQWAVDAVLKSLCYTGEILPMEGSALVELTNLPRAMTLLSKLGGAQALTGGQVDRWVHFVVLDLLLKNLLPYRATVSHLFLGYLIDEGTGPLSLPASSSSFPSASASLDFGLQRILRNLSAPFFHTLAPLLAEGAFELVYRLCQSPKTRQATLTYLLQDGVDFFHHQFHLLTRRPFPSPPASPSPSSFLSPLPGARRRSSLRSHQLGEGAPESLGRYLQAHLSYSSSLQMWAWFLQSMALLLFHAQHLGTHSRSRRLLSLLLSSPPPTCLPGGQSGDGDQDSEAQTCTLTWLLQQLQLAHQGEVPQPPTEEMRAVAERCSIPLPGLSGQGRVFRGIQEDFFLHEVRLALGTSQVAMGPGTGEGMGEMGMEMGGAGIGASAEKGRIGGMRSPAGTNIMVGGPPEATLHSLRVASDYCLRYNHFLLRQAAEYHVCVAWKRLAEAVVRESRESPLLPHIQGPLASTPSSPPQAFSLLLTLLSQAVNKLAQHPQGDVKALEQISTVILVSVDAIWRYAMNRTGGLALTVLSLDEGQRILQLLLQALLCALGGQEGEPGRLTQQKLRAQGYCSIILYLRATTVWPLPAAEASMGGETRSSVPMLTAGEGDRDASRSTSWDPTDKGLRVARQDKNAEALTAPRFFRPLLHVLAEDAAFTPSLGKARSRYQACAASCLGLVLETLVNSSAASASASQGVYLPLGVAPQIGKYDSAIREAVEYLPRLLEGLNAQYCMERETRRGSRDLVFEPVLQGAYVGGKELYPPPALPSPGWAVLTSRKIPIEGNGGSTEKPVGARNTADGSGDLYEERPWDATFRFYLTLLTQAVSDARGAQILLERGVLDSLSGMRFLAMLEDVDGPSVEGMGRRKEELLDNLGGVLRLLQTMMSKLPLHADLCPQVEKFLRRHSRVLMQFMEARQQDLGGLEELGVMVGLLAQTVGVKGSGVLGYGAPPSLSSSQDEYRRLINDLFERFGVELLPPLAVRFHVRAPAQGWWAVVEDADDHAIPCEPPHGASPQYSWRVSDAFKLLVSQVLLVHLTTYMRRRLRKSRYPNVRVEIVLVALRMSLSLLVAQGNGPSPPIPSIKDVFRGGFTAVAASVAPVGQRVPWDYAYLRTSLRYIFENLVDILYHLVCYRVELDPDFPREQVHTELLKALQGQEEWLERQTDAAGGMGYGSKWSHLKMTLDAIQDKLRV